MATQAGSLLATRRGRLTLLLLCAVQFLDIADSSIMNVALPSIRRDLGFSVQGLRWVLSGYLLTYGGFLLLGGRAADAPQMIAFAGFVSLFFFLTLYMQDVLGYSPIQGGSAYLPVTAGIVAATGISSRLFTRIGTRPVTVAGALIAAAAIFDLSRVPVHGSYLTDLLPGLVVMSIGLARPELTDQDQPTPAHTPQQTPQHTHPSRHSRDDRGHHTAARAGAALTKGVT